MAEERAARVLGDYELVEELGRGGFATAYLARPRASSTRDAERVVIKRLHESFGSDTLAIKRFRHEAKLAISVDSPHVVRVLELGFAESSPYIVMEYVPGWQLARLLGRLRASPVPMPIEIAVHFARDALLGLAALHEARLPETGEPLGIVHRDLSPRNILVREDGRLCLIDLGIGRSNAQDWVTKTGAVLGSRGYMSPEQARGEHPDARADVYSIGVLFFEMLTGDRYFPRTNGIPPTIEQMKEPTFRAPSEMRSDVPRALDEILRRALAIDVEERYADARAFLDAIDAAGVRTPYEEEVFAYVDTMMVDEPTRASTPLGFEVKSTASLSIPKTRILARRRARVGVRSERGLWAALAAIVLALPIALAAVLAPRPAPPTRSAAAAIVEPDATVQPTAHAIEQNVPPAKLEVAADARVHSARRPGRTRALGAAEKAVEPVQEDVADRLARLTERATLMMRARPERTSEIKQILADATFWGGSHNRDRALEAIRELSHRLDRMGE